MTEPLSFQVLLEILTWWSALFIVGLGIERVINKVREWDRASLGLVAGTHKRWDDRVKEIPAYPRPLPEGPVMRTALLTDRMGQILASFDQMAISLANVGKVANAVSVSVQTLMHNQDSINLYYGIGSNWPTIKTSIDSLGAGKFKLTYMEGTIND